MSGFHNPNEHPIEAYASYKSRARFPNLVSFLYRGLMGLASADTPAMTLPDEMMYLEDDMATQEGLTLSRLFAKTLGEVLLVGRHEHVLDVVPATNGNPDRIYIVDYCAEQFINWKMKNRVPQTSVFFEKREKKDSPNNFAFDMNDFYVVQTVDGGTYKVLTFDSVTSNTPDVMSPTYKGRTLDKIPITVYGSLNNTLSVDPAPMLPVANTAIQIYQKDADLAQSEYLSCNPTLVITGASSDDGTQTIITGPTVAIRASNPDAKVYYTQTDTSALRFILDHITVLYEQSIVYGAQLLDSSKKSAESAETARLRQTAASATLKSVVTTVGQGMERTLKGIGQWMGLSDAALAEITFKPITEFGLALTPQEQEQLVQSWLAGAISHDTVLTNFRKAGILPEGVSEENELTKIQSEAPKITEVPIEGEGQPAASVRANI
jgi:hypothetical protein